MISSTETFGGIQWIVLNTYAGQLCTQASSLNLDRPSLLGVCFMEEMLLSFRLALQFEFTLFNAMTVFKTKNCQIVVDNSVETTCNLCFGEHTKMEFKLQSPSR